MTAARPRILYVEVNEDGTVGGSHQALFDLVRFLDRGRFEPVVLFYQDNEFAHRLRDLSVEVHLFERERAHELAVRLSGRRVAKFVDFWGAILRRVRFLRRNRIAVVHLNNSPRVGADDWLPAARLAGARCMVTAMDMEAAVAEPHPVRRWLMRHFDMVLAISKHMEHAMERAGIPEHRLSRVSLGVDCQGFRQRVGRSPPDLRDELGVPTGALLVVMVGNIRRWKGQHVVLDALRRLPAASRRTLRVAFVGAAAAEHAEYERELIATVREHGLDDCVLFLGGRRDVPDLINAADLVVHASVSPEPFGLVIVEALTLGKPVIAARIGGPVEIVTPECGALFDPAAPEQLAALLEELAGDPERRSALGAGAVRRSEEFDARTYAERLELAYERVLFSAGRVSAG